jgi:hypothetical protein
LIDAGPSWKLALVGTIELLCHELAVPAYNGLRFDDGGDLRQGLLTQFLADLGQSLALGITELDAPLDLVAQDAIFGYQILVSQQEFFIHRA